MAQVLLVEDDAGIRASLTRDLRARGHVVVSAPAGAEALALVAKGAPEVVLLDLGLPDLDGADVLAMIRSLSHVAVIVATARDEDADMVRLLNAGADDYVVKPFTAAQIDARIRAVMRRVGSPDVDETDQRIRVGEIEIDPRSREATINGSQLDLSRKEFDLLVSLARRADEVVTKRAIFADVWQQPWGGGDRTVDVHLSWLRRKLGETAANPRYLHSVRGVGIRMSAPGSAAGSAEPAADTHPVGGTKD
ncbi:MAG: response regulator transcription factor [Nocardioidaceae bacterium]